MVVRPLPLELQHEILRLCLPFPNPKNLAARRAACRNLSLVHRDWTPIAQRELFAWPRLCFVAAGGAAGVRQHLKKHLKRNAGKKCQEIKARHLARLHRLEIRVAGDLLKLRKDDRDVFASLIARAASLTELVVMAEYWVEGSGKCAFRPADFPNLKALHFRHSNPYLLCPWSKDTYRPLATLPTVKTLTLSEMWKVDLGEYPNIETLFVSRSSLSSLAGEAMPNLRRLGWCDNLPALCPELHRVNLHSTLEHVFVGVYRTVVSDSPCFFQREVDEFCTVLDALAASSSFKTFTFVTPPDADLIPVQAILQRVDEKAAAGLSFEHRRMKEEDVEEEMWRWAQSLPKE
ncbi:hypothetical protein JCM6882_004619 [Rhodosporidiobolus microsporus]